MVVISGGERNSIPNCRKNFPVTGIDLQKPIIDFRQKNLYLSSPALKIPGHFF